MRHSHLYFLVFQYKLFKFLIILQCPSKTVHRCSAVLNWEMTDGSQIEASTEAMFGGQIQCIVTRWLSGLSQKTSSTLPPQVYPSQARVSSSYICTYFKCYFLAQETQMDSDNSLFEKNLIPGISSRLPLNTASVFYFGVIGKGKRSDEQEVMQVCMYLNSSS